MTTDNSKNENGATICPVWISLDTQDMRLYLFECLVLTAVCCLVWSGLGLVLDLVSGWLVVMHTYLYYYFRLSLSHCPLVQTLSSLWKYVNATKLPLNRIGFQIVHICL